VQRTQKAAEKKQKTENPTKIEKSTKFEKSTKIEKLQKTINEFFIQLKKFWIAVYPEKQKTEKKQYKRMVNEKIFCV